MPSKAYFDSRQRLVDAFAGFLDALWAESQVEETPRTASTPSPTRAKAAPETVPGAPRRVPAPTAAASLEAQADALDGRGVTAKLPAQPPARRPKVELTDAQHQENLPAATDLARRVRQLLGDGPTAFEGFKQKIALEYIPNDDKLILEAWEAGAR